MSFSSEVKREIAYNQLMPCCSKAQLSALLRMTSYLDISNQGFVLICRSENPTISRRIMSLLKDLYKVQTELTYYQKSNLKKNKVYEIRIHKDAIKILEDLGIYNSEKGIANYPRYELIRKDCCARAYIAGSFLAYGACNNPNKANYHLEIVTNEEESVQFLLKLLKRFDIEAKISKRRNKYVLYLKKADSISDFLRCVGAQEALMNFENTRISRDFINSKIRLDNCDIANMQKSLKTAREQLEAIEYLKRSNKFNDLDQRLQDVANLRYTYSEHSLSELALEYERIYHEKISRSGLKHRFDKLLKIAKGG